MILTTSLAATAQQFGDFTYTSDGSAVTITGYTGPGGAVIIPDSINGLPVTTIGNNAFYNQFGVTSVTIPTSVTWIGSAAFAGCTSLASITIPADVTTIGDGTFASCTSLTRIAIPGSVTWIGSGAFNFCTGLTNITMPGSVTHIGNHAFDFCTKLTVIAMDGANAFYSSLDGALFNKNQTTLLVCPGGKAGTYTIPSSVTSIADFAFETCTSLANVTIPGSVTSIGQFAFYYCTNLNGVFFGGNAPGVILNAFESTSATVYYVPGATGWDATFAGRPAVLWNPLMQASSVGSAGFGFNITGTADIPIVIEGATSLANATWVPLQSLNLTNGAFYFSDPDWTNYPARFYRIRSP